MQISIERWHSVTDWKIQKRLVCTNSNTDARLIITSSVVCVFSVVYQQCFKGQHGFSWQLVSIFQSFKVQRYKTCLRGVSSFVFVHWYEGSVCDWRLSVPQIRPPLPQQNETPSSHREMEKRPFPLLTSRVRFIYDTKLFVRQKLKVCIKNKQWTHGNDLCVFVSSLLPSSFHVVVY